MKRAIGLIVALCTVCGYGQRTATTTLMVQVRPEAYVVPSQIPLHFRVSADGASDVTVQTATITAWVRALPGQAIRIVARPSAGFPFSWSGSATRATQGAQSASCTSGTSDGMAPAELVSGWSRSGILTCAVTFFLTDARALDPGLYTANVDLAIAQ